MLLLYGRLKRVPLRVGMDIIAPCLMIGLALGRLGCFLNGCCYGAECELPIAVKFPYYSYAYVEQAEQGKIQPPPELMPYIPGHGRVLLPPDEVKQDPELALLARRQHTLPVHPTQLYSTVTALLIAWLLLAYFPLCPVPGRVFALMLMIEPVTRFLLEMLRVEPAVLGAHELQHGGRDPAIRRRRAPVVRLRLVSPPPSVAAGRRKQRLCQPKLVSSLIHPAFSAHSSRWFPP